MRAHEAPLLACVMRPEQYTLRSYSLEKLDFQRGSLRVLALVVDLVEKSAVVAERLRIGNQPLGQRNRDLRNGKRAQEIGSEISDFPANILPVVGITQLVKCDRRFIGVRIRVANKVPACQFGNSPNPIIFLSKFDL